LGFFPQFIHRGVEKKLTLFVAVISSIYSKNMDRGIFKKLGFSDKATDIYLKLLNLGPSSVRKLAEETDINRGTTYDILKWLKDVGVVDFYNKKAKQTFVAEHPMKLRELLIAKEVELRDVERSLEKTIPELSALHDKGGERPVARYYSKGDIPSILEDVLESCERDEERVYRIYSTEGMRKYLYDGFETFSDVRVAKGVGVKVIAIGAGGELRGLDERKYMVVEDATPTYIIIYPSKTAYISLDAKDEVVGVVIENDGISETQKNIFDNLWDKL
jgi:HTH-type transcriptional regulator, sugar sensing transcriptional regulator